MENKILIGTGIGVGCIVLYLLYKWIRSNKKEASTEGIDDNVNVEYVDSIDYEYLYEWLRSEYKEQKEFVSAGCKFGIMPDSLSRNAYEDESGINENFTGTQGVICAFIIDEKEKNMITHKFFVYNQMSNSLKEILPADKVYIQNLK